MVTRSDSLRAHLNGVHAVVFDAEGTLFSLARPVGEIYSDVCRRFGLELDPKLLDVLLHKEWKARYAGYLSKASGYVTSEDEEQEKWKQLVYAVLEQAVQGRSAFLREVGEAIYQEFSESRTRTLREGAIEVLEELKERDVITAILSNNDSRLLSLLENLELSHLIDHALPTSTLGYKKPSPLCYKRALERIGTKASTTLSIGNDAELDYLAPTREGWRALFLVSDDMYANSSTPGHDERIPPDRVLYSFDELLELF